MRLRVLSLALLFVALILPLPTHGDSGDCSMAVPTRLAVGVTARISVMGGSGITLRETPGTRYRPVVNLLDGAIINVINGPVCTDSARWWQIRVVNSKSGWLLEEYAAGYQLQPNSMDVIRHPVERDVESSTRSSRSTQIK
jgi:hypothetical protein